MNELLIPAHVLADCWRRLSPYLGPEFDGEIRFRGKGRELAGVTLPPVFITGDEILSCPLDQTAHSHVD